MVPNKISHYEFSAAKKNQICSKSVIWMYTRNRSEEPLDAVINVTIQLVAEVKIDLQGHIRQKSRWLWDGPAQLSSHTESWLISSLFLRIRQQNPAAASSAPKHPWTLPHHGRLHQLVCDNKTTGQEQYHRGGCQGIFGMSIPLTPYWLCLELIANTVLPRAWEQAHLHLTLVPPSIKIWPRATSLGE